MSTVWGNVEYVDTSKTIGKKMRDYTSASTTMMIKEACTSSERSEESDQEPSGFKLQISGLKEVDGTFIANRARIADRCAAFHQSFTDNRARGLTILRTEEEPSFEEWEVERTLQHTASEE